MDEVCGDCRMSCENRCCFHQQRADVEFITGLSGWWMAARKSRVRLGLRLARAVRKKAALSLAQ
jgi:hypothetical protein